MKTSRATDLPLRCLACGEACAFDVHIECATCPVCGHKYSIEAEVCRSVLAEVYGGSFGYQWNIHRKTQLDSYTGLPLSRDRVAAALGDRLELNGLSVMEAGSGAGRFTEVLASTGANVTTFDLSSAIYANQNNNGHHPNVRFFQADIFDPPFVFESFDLVICLGVVQHTPDPLRAVESLARFVKPGGRLVVDCYAKNLRSLLNWKYILRPLTKRVKKDYLYKTLENVVPPLIRPSAWLRRNFGPAGMRLLPILQYEHWGLTPNLNRDWAILDTFDMLSPTYDHPQTVGALRAIFDRLKFEQIDVHLGANGVVASGYRQAL